MNILDLIVFVVCGFVCYKCTKKGLILGVSRIVGLVLGFFFANLFFGRLGEHMMKIEFFSPVSASVLSFILIYLCVFLGCHFLGKLIEKIAVFAHLSFLNYLGGFFVGLVLSVLIVVPVFLPFVLMKNSLGPENLLETSFIYQIASPFLDILIEEFQFLFDDISS